MSLQCFELVLLISLAGQWMHLFQLNLRSEQSAKEKTDFSKKPIWTLVWETTGELFRSSSSVGFRSSISTHTRSELDHHLGRNKSNSHVKYRGESKFPSNLYYSFFSQVLDEWMDLMEEQCRTEPITNVCTLPIMAIDRLPSIILGQLSHTSISDQWIFERIQ